MGKTAKSNAKSISVNQSHYFLIFLLFFALFACYKIIAPYLDPIILAMILATVLGPVHRRIERLFKGKKNLSAFVSCVLLTLVVVLPVMVMLLSLIHQGINSFTAISAWIKSGNLTPLVMKMIALAEKYLPDIGKISPELDLKKINIEQASIQASKTVGTLLFNQGKNIAGNITALIGKFFLMIFTFFFFVRDEKRIFEYILHLVPLSTSYEDKIMEKIKAVSRSALLGTFVTALAQGAAGGIAFKIAGLPGLFWGMMMAFASLIPMVGTALIWIPAAGYLFISGHFGLAIFMVLWCVIVVGMIDNFLRPMFMQGSADMSTLLIFFSIIGGMNYFGLIGLLYGPLVFGLAMVLLYIYSLEFESFLNNQDER